MVHQKAILTLIEDVDPARRAEAHKILAVRAQGRSDVRSAVRHLREAVALVPDHSEARRLLLSLEGVEGPKRGFFSWLLGNADA